MIMMIIYLIIMIAFMFVSYYFSKKSVLSPTFIVSGMYALSGFLLLFYIEKWRFELSGITLFIIILALISLLLGETCGRIVRIRKQLFIFSKSVDLLQCNIDNLSQMIDRISNVKLFLCIIFSLLTFLFYIKETQKLVNNFLSSGITSYNTEYFMLVNDAKVLGNMSVSYYVQHMLTITGVLAMILGYILVFNLSNKGKLLRHPAYYIVPIIYILTCLLTSGRARAMWYMVYIMVVMLLMHAISQRWRFRQNIKILAKCLLIGCMVIIGFYFAGYLTGKALYYENIFDNLANYFSSSIYALDYFLDNQTQFLNSNAGWGSYSLSGIFRIAQNLGIKTPNSIVALEYIPCGDVLTNIYTPLRRYYQDFGYIGIILIMFIMGFFYSGIVNFIKRSGNIGLLCIIVAYCYYPLIFMSIEERLFMDIIVMNTFYVFIYLWIGYRWLLSNKKKRIQI